MRLSFVLTMGEEERSLVLFWQETGEGRDQNMRASGDSPDSGVRALDLNE